MRRGYAPYIYIYMIKTSFFITFWELCAGDMRRPLLQMSVLIMGEPMIPPANEFWVCAGYALGEFLVWIKMGTLDDTFVNLGH